MKALVVYSSLTGNTKLVAEAIAEELQADLAAVEENPDAQGYDWLAVGYWVDRGGPDAKAAAYLKALRGQKVALFATLGADPSSEHAQESLRRGQALLDDSNTCLGSFICQGKVDPKLIEQMAKLFPAGHPHGMNEERRARHRAASTHPDARDLSEARRVFREIGAKLAEGSGA